MSKIEETIAALENQLKQVKALKQKIEARKKTLASKKTRAAETKKKILIGALMLEKMDQQEETRIRILAELDQFLTKKSDRAIFDLSDNPTATKTPNS